MKFPATVDYSYGRPKAADIKAAGYRGAMRYLGEDNRCLKSGERFALHAEGLGIGLIYETIAERALSGFDGGAADARVANAYADGHGAPRDVPIFYAVDFEPTSTQLSGAVSDYFHGALAASGRPVRAYGCARVMEHLCGYLKLMPCGWQCVAWSYGRVSTYACQLQQLGYVLGGTCDHNTILMTDIDWLWFDPPLKPPKPVAPDEEDDVMAPPTIAWTQPGSVWVHDVVQIDNAMSSAFLLHGPFVRWLSPADLDWWRFELTAQYPGHDIENENAIPDTPFAARTYLPHDVLT